jgi:hypothetical protein
MGYDDLRHNGWSFSSSRVEQSGFHLAPRAKQALRK